MDASIRVLHVDDDPEFLDLTATVLEREDDRFVVETATSASEGLDRLADDVDCIVSDYDLQGTNGIEFLDAVREAYPDLPFILFTGAGSEAVASDAITAGVTDYLQKDIGTEQFAILANRIGNAVDQYRSHAALAASKERLSLFIEQSPLGVIEWDTDFEVVRLNDAGEEILGYAEEELTGESWDTLVPDTDREQVGEVISELMDAEGGYHSTNENVRADGERIVCEWHNRVVTDEDGETVAAFSQFRDVTERVERERELERTTARLTALFERSPLMINVHDADGNIIDPNPQLCEKTGYDEAELTGMKVWEIDQSLGPDEARSEWDEMDIGDRRQFAGTFERRDGSTFPVEVHVRHLDLEGENRFAVISRDVSERKERERELERYEAIVENTEDGIYVFDEEARFEFVNRRVVDVSGIPLEGWVGEHVSVHADLGTLGEDDVAAVERGIEAVLGGDDEARIDLAPDVPGDIDALELRLTPFRTAEGGDRVVGFTRDVSEQKEYERQLEAKNERLAEFATLVSHDLRNPLHVAQGQVELLREECDHEAIDKLARTHERMETLIEDILVLARDGDAVTNPDAVDLGTFVEDCWERLATDAATLVVETDRTIQADRSRLQQLLENLVGNAIDHGGEGVTVRVGHTDEGFYVADDGPGIPDGECDRIFESGYSTAPDGTGYGLRIVDQIAGVHGWSVTVTESEAGGARFEIGGVEFADR